MEYSTIDGYSFLGEIYKPDLSYIKYRKVNPVIKGIQKVYTYWTKETRAVIACLVLTGVVTGLIATFVEFCINALLFYRKQFAETLTNRWELQFLIWISWSFAFVVLAGCCSKYITNAANGSGIPEMKTIMSGIEMPQYLSFKCLVSKVIGVTCGQVAELYMGRVGPFVHVGACVCAQIMQLPFLKGLRENYHLRMQMLSAACSLGPAAVFGAPVGGVFFSIEVTATFFYVHSLWKGILCAVSAKIAHSYFRGMSPFLPGTTFSAIFAVEQKLTPFTGTEFFILIVAGIIVSFCGAGFTVATKRYVMFRSRFPWWKTSIWGQLIVASLIIGMVSYPSNDLTFGQFDSFRSLVSTGDLSNTLTPWETVLALFIVGVIKFTLVIVCGTLPLPAGLFAPTLLLGAHIGRMIGEIVDILFPELQVNPAGYALIGMTAFPCAVTSTFSPAVITVEAIGSLEYLVPCLLVSVIGYSVGEMVNHSIYSVMIRFRKMPFLSANLSPKFTGRLAAEVMDSDCKYVTYETTPMQVKEVLKTIPKDQTAIPVVLSENNKELLGGIQRVSIIRMLEKFDNDTSRNKILRFMYRYQTTRKSLVALRPFVPTDTLDVEHVNESVEIAEMPSEIKGWCQSCWDIGFDPDKKKEEEEEKKAEKVAIEMATTGGNVELEEEEEEAVPEEEEQEEEEEETEEKEEETPESPKEQEKTKKVTFEEPQVETGLKQRRTRQLHEMIATGGFDLHLDDPTQPYIEFDPAPYQTPSHTPMVKIQYVFSMLTLTQIFITYRGKLVGIVTKKRLVANPDRSDIPFGG